MINIADDNKPLEEKKINLEEMKVIQLNMLDFFHSYCIEHKLKYFLTGGSLIGAIRHKGYIPWDDDIDIAMPRYDYDRLIASFNRNSKNQYKVLSTLTDKDYYLPFAKIVDVRTTIVEHTDVAKPIGIFIDIFPLDNMGNDYNEAKNLFDKVKKERYKLSLKTISLSKERSAVKNGILFLGKIITSCLSAHDMSEKIDKIASSKKNITFTKYICPVVIATYGEREILDSALYADTIEVEFEGRKFFAPAGYDDVLSKLYGDYMQLPPVEKRITHHSFDAWWKEE